MHGYDVVDPTRVEPGTGRRRKGSQRCLVTRQRRQGWVSSSISCPTIWRSAATITAGGPTCFGKEPDSAYLRNSSISTSDSSDPPTWMARSWRHSWAPLWEALKIRRYQGTFSDEGAWARSPSRITITASRSGRRTATPPSPILVTLRTRAGRPARAARTAEFRAGVVAHRGRPDKLASFFRRHRTGGAQDRSAGGLRGSPWHPVRALSKRLGRWGAGRSCRRTIRSARLLPPLRARLNELAVRASSPAHRPAQHGLSLRKYLAPVRHCQPIGRSMAPAATTSWMP